MIVYKDIIQGTPEWHEIRYGKIGGTCANQLYLNTDTLFINTLSCYLEPFEMEEDGYANDAMIRGIELEPMARKALEDYTGVIFNDVGWLEHQLVPLIGISPDGLSEDHTAMCEIKCPGKEKHTRTLFENKIPSDHIDQCLHAFTVNDKLQTIYFASFRPESKHPLFVKALHRSDNVDLGTKSKPVIKPVDEWVLIGRTKARVIDANIKTAIHNLDF